MDDDGTWKGDAYDAYLERFERQLLHWKRAGEWLRAGASALFTWADALQWARDEADRAITLWNEAEQQGAAALIAHRAHLRELRIGQGLRHPEADVPFVDPSGPAHDEAREVLFNARATLEVYARDCAIRLDEAADAARMPLTDAEAATQAQHAMTEVIVNLAVVQPFQATMDLLAVSAQTLWEHPDIILELLGGAAMVVGGAAVAAGGGAITVTGVGALAGSPALVVAGVGAAGAGAMMVGDAAGRWFNESHAVGDRVRGLDRGDRRDYRGTFAEGENPPPWVDKEKVGLDRHAEARGVEVIRTKARADYEGSPQNGRIYDGLVKNNDGPNTYTGIEVKSGGAIDRYGPHSTQWQFDEAVRTGTPAHSRLNGENIIITRVETEIVP
nr:hypothetical protein [Microbacterium sp. WCS2018Hpa-9]